MILRLLRHHVNRFRVEIGLFWLVSLATSIALATGAEPVVRLCLARLELVGLAWVSIRLLLAEEGFKVSGGWKSRPISGAAVFATPVLLLLVTILMPLGVRALLLQRMLGLDATGWDLLVRGSWLPQFTRWLIFACGVKLFGLLILRGLEGKAKAAAWGALSLALLPLASFSWHSVRFETRNYSRGGSQGGPQQLAQGIQLQLSDATDFIGSWNDRVSGSQELPQARLLLRVPLQSGATVRNGRLLEARAAVEGVRVRARIRLLLVDARQLDRLVLSCAIIRYADGTYATANEHLLSKNPGSGALFSAGEFGFAGSFISPLSLPEFEGDLSRLLAGAELLFFDGDLSKPPLVADSWRLFHREIEKAVPFEPSSLPAGSDAATLKAVMQILVDAFNSERGGWTDFEGRDRLARQLPKEALPFLLKSGPWSDHAWGKMVCPFLVKHAGDADRPALLARLESDPRLGEVFVAKGWAADAMPLLRRHAKERLPMPASCIGLLAKEQDASMATDLAALTLMLRSDIGTLEPLLRQHPGFDWPAFVAAGWKRWKYDFRVQGDGELGRFAVWAAQEGDLTAFQHLGEFAARGNGWYAKQLGTLVAGQHGDLIGYLRENLGRFRFDPATHQWGL